MFGLIPKTLNDFDLDREIQKAQSYLDQLNQEKMRRFFDRMNPWPPTCPPLPPLIPRLPSPVVPMVPCPIRRPMTVRDILDLVPKSK